MNLIRLQKYCKKNTVLGVWQIFIENVHYCQQPFMLILLAMGIYVRIYFKTGPCLKSNESTIFPCPDCQAVCFNLRITNGLIMVSL